MNELFLEGYLMLEMTVASTRMKKMMFACNIMSSHCGKNACIALGNTSSRSTIRINQYNEFEFNAIGNASGAKI